MSQTDTNPETPRRKSLLKMMNDGGVVIGFAVTIIGGYVWLESNYARIDKLSSEKCALSYEIRITRADIEFTGVDEEIVLHRNELESLLQASSAPAEHIDFKKAFIKRLEDRAERITKEKECLRRAKDGCFQNNHDTGQCYE